MGMLDEINSKLRWLDQAFERLDEEGREPDDALRKQVEEFFGDAVESQDDKLNAYAWVIRRLVGEADECKAIADEFARKSKGRRSRADWLKSCIFWFMKDRDQTKIKTSQWSFGIQKNGGVSPVEIESQEDIPLEYWVTEPRLDLERIRSDLERGVEVPGAKLGDRGEHLRIR